MALASKIKEGEIFSEESFFVAVGKKYGSDEYKFINLKTGAEVILDTNYINNYLQSASQYSTVVKVTKEDTRQGKLGIRSIFESLKSSDVFTVVYDRQPREKSLGDFLSEKKVITESVKLKLKEAFENESPKEFSKIVDSAITKLVEYPVLREIPATERTLIGRKIQFQSRDGRYSCEDIILKKNGDPNYVRPVNINTIKSLIVNNIKYEVV